MTITSPIGQEISRVDGLLKVTGQATYTADYPAAGKVYGYVIQSTIATGAVTAMDTTAARNSPGVVAVYTPFDPLPVLVTPFGENYAPLQDTTVRFRGQIIGLVLAETFEQARDASTLVTTTYTETPARTSLAIGPDPTGTLPPAFPTVPPVVEPLLAPGVASIDDALDNTAIRIDCTVSQPAHTHAAMEPHGTTAVWNGDQLTVYTGAQVLSLAALTIAGRVGVDPSQVRVVTPYVGGGFGSRVPTWSESALAAVAARTIGRPVKLILARQQDFSLGGHRPTLTQTVRLGANADGTLTAVSHHADVELPAVGGWATTPPGETTAVLYRTPNLDFGQRYVTLDTPGTWAMRAPNESPGAFAIETAMDELAVAANIDPVELRLRNYATADPHTGRPWTSKHLDECYRVGAERFGWSDRSPEPRSHTDGDWLIGMGMATAIYPANAQPASVRIRLRADGTATAESGTSDLGTGARTVLAIVAADALGLPLERVSADVGDSALPPGAPAAGSMATGSTAPVVQAAASDAINAFKTLAVEHPQSPFAGTDPAALIYRDGLLERAGQTITFAELLAAVGQDVIEVTATNPAPGPDPAQFVAHSFGAHFCEVRVHRLTGEPRVNRITTVVDIGRVINAKAVRSQIVGGVIFGIGHALLEANPIEPSGRLAHNSLADYLVPINADVPHIDATWIDNTDTNFNSFGARGVGELGTVGSAAAIGNAIYNATGMRVRDLPITLDKLLA